MLQRHTERPLSDRDRLDWLRLARTDRVGPVTFANLIARFGSAGAALVEIPGMARRGGGKNFVLPEEDAIAAEMERLDALGGQLICSCEPDFPRGLGALDPPPPVISILGHRHLLRKEMIARITATPSRRRRIVWARRRDCRPLI